MTILLSERVKKALNRGSDAEMQGHEPVNDEIPGKYIPFRFDIDAAIRGMKADRLRLYRECRRCGRAYHHPADGIIICEVYQKPILSRKRPECRQFVDAEL